MVGSFALWFLFVAVVASFTLGAASAWLVVRKTKQPVLWVLAPVFAVLWLTVGLVPLVFGLRASAVPAPIPPVPPGPIQVTPGEEAPAP